MFLFRLIIAVVASVLAALLGVSYGVSFLPPADAGYGVLLSFGFPYLWCISFVLMVLLLVGRRFVGGGVLLVAVLLTASGFTSVARLGGRSGAGAPDGALRVVSYNMSMLHSVKGKADAVDYILSDMPDILCVQEFNYNIAKDDKNGAHRIIKAYPHILTDRKQRGSGQTIFSKYPIKHISTEGKPYHNPHNVLVADVAVGNTAIRVCNCHLQSILITETVKNNAVTNRDKAPGVARKLVSASVKRSEQVDKLALFIADNADVPLMVCGDFNDTPISYTYHTLTEQMNDAFVEAGSGWGDTFNGKLPPLRIDYILHSDHLRASRYKVPDVSCSDHFPVECFFEL